MTVNVGALRSCYVSRDVIFKSWVVWMPSWKVRSARPAETVLEEERKVIHTVLCCCVVGWRFR